MQGSDFLPSRDGFPFRNDFEYPPSRVGRGAPVAQGYGLAGGMCLAALDRWLTGRPLPSPDTVPQPGQPLYEELTRRQVELLGQGTWSRILDWQSRPGVRRRLGPAGLAELTRAEWARLRRSLDAGLPSIVCILRTRGPFANPSENPLLLAYRYEWARETRRATVWLYDPNRPGNDDVRMTVALGGRRRPPETTYIAERVRGFLTLPYDRPARNSTLRAVELRDGSAGGMAGIAAPLHGRGLGAAVRGRDGSLLVIDGSTKKGKETAAPRVQRLADSNLVGDPVVIGGRSATILARDANGVVVVFRRGMRGWRGRPLPGLAEKLQIEFGPVGIVARGKLHAFGVRKGKLVHMVRHRTGRWTAGEVVAQASPDGTDLLEGTPVLCQSADRGLHVFVRTAKGRIAHMRLTTEDKWMAALLPAVENPVASDPVVAKAPGDDQITVFAVSEAGELIQTRGSGTDTWRVRNLTKETAVDGGPHSVRVEIAVSQGPANTLHVFGVSPKNGLIHYWCPPTLAWRAQDLTHGRPDIGDSARVRGRPSVTHVSDDQLVVATAGEKGVVVYRWTAASDWTGDVLPAPHSLAEASVPIGPVIWVDSAGETHLVAVLEDGRAILGLPGRPDSAHRRVRVATKAGTRPPARPTPARAGAVATSGPVADATEDTVSAAIAAATESVEAQAADAMTGMVDEAIAKPEAPPLGDVESFGSFDTIGSFESLGEDAGSSDLSFGSPGGIERTSLGADDSAEEPTLLDIGFAASASSDDAPSAESMGLLGADLHPMDAEREQGPVTKPGADARDDLANQPLDLDRDGWGSYPAPAAPAAAAEEASGDSLDLGSIGFQPAAPLLPNAEAGASRDLDLPFDTDMGLTGEPSAAERKAAEKAARAAEKEAARAAAKKAAGEEAARVAAEKKAAEKEAARVAAEKKAAETEAVRLAAEKKAAQEEAARAASQKKAAEKEAARIAAEKKAAEKEAARVAAEKKAAEDEALRIAAEQASAEKAAAEKAAAEKIAAEKAAAEKAEAERKRAASIPARTARQAAALEGLPLLDEDTPSPAPRPADKDEKPKERPPSREPGPKPRLRSVDDLIRLSDEHDPKFEKK